MRRLPVDNWGIPTGEAEEWNGATEPLETAEYDDGFDTVPDGAVFALGRRRPPGRVAASRKGYPAAQLFAPGSEALVAIEPMAAPTDALRRGNYRCAVAGKPETTRFSIRVT